VNPEGLIESITGNGFAGELRSGESLSVHTSLRVGGPADLLALPAGDGDLQILLELLQKENVPWMVLGGGTNVLFANGGYHGCVIQLPGSSGPWSDITVQELCIEAGAAASLSTVVARAAKEGLAGLESLAGIPGTVGGALRMNAGTRSGQISDVVKEVRLLDRVGDTEGIRWVPASEVGFSYRNCGLSAHQVVLAVRFDLEKEDPEAILTRMKEQKQARKGSQPLGEISAGCWFKNPEGDSAGRLIDEAGMKGMRCGGALVSEVHANFLVNAGSATAGDFLELAGKVRKGVREKFGIELEEEVRIVGG